MILAFRTDMFVFELFDTSVLISSGRFLSSTALKKKLFAFGLINVNSLVSPDAFFLYGKVSEQKTFLCIQRRVEHVLSSIKKQSTYKIRNLLSCIDFQQINTLSSVYIK